MASGSSNGTTKVAMTVQTHLERYKDLLLLKLDASNAFNSANRKKLITRTIHAFPSMYSYIRAMHFQDAHLYVCRAKDMDTYIKSQEGTQQGDPLASLMYISGLKPVHQKAIRHMMALQRVWQTKYPQSDTDGWLILAYADDIFVVAPPEIAVRIYMQLDHEVAVDLDAKFNLSKLETVTMGNITSATNRMRRACRGFTNCTEAGTGYTCKYEVLDDGTKLKTTYTFLDTQTRKQTTECYVSTIFTPSDVDTYMTAVEGTDVLGIPIGPDTYRLKANIQI